MEHGTPHAIVEALILASPEPIESKKIAESIEGMTVAKVATMVSELNDKYTQGASAFRIREIAGGFQFHIIPEYTGYVEDLFTRRRKMRLTQAALETLAIVAYRQPITKSEVEHVRGVASDGVIHNLLEKSMITIKGRAKGVGKALQYGTTDEFLKFFGLNDLDALPRMSEIEELVRAAEDRRQTELRLENVAATEAMSMKLNVADGTFDPASREEEELIEVETEETEAI
ncbi:MAG: SMC-Scp complex subunit ScpB [Candidatus Zixiibacteriota bacterium]